MDDRCKWIETPRDKQMQRAWGPMVKRGSDKNGGEPFALLKQPCWKHGNGDAQLRVLSGQS